MNDEGAQAKAKGPRVRTAAALSVAALVFGLFLTLTQSEDPAPVDLVTDAPQVPATSSPDRPATADEPVSEAAERTETANVDAPDQASPIVPSVDEVRLETDGLTVIAGRAEPGAQVSVRVDGEEVATAVADARGAFAAVGFVAPSTAARVVTLSASGAQGDVVSDADVILAPVVPPVADAPAAETPAPAIATAEPDPSDDVQAPQSSAPAAGAVAQTDSVEEEAPGLEVAATTTRDADPADTSQTEAVAALPAQADNTAPPAVAPAPVPDDPVAEPTAQAPAAEAVTVLKSTAEGVEVLQPAPEVATSVAIDTIGYSEEGEVQLSGRAVIGTSEVRVYLDNRFTTSLPVDTDGAWRGSLPQVDVGRYRLRVDEVNSAGGVTSRVETPFQREAPAALVAADTADAGPVRAVTVQTGDTLWAIARDRYGEGVLYVKVVEANRDDIRDPDLIYPGQVFDLPVE
ncbi:peptidoglycan-binding protein LysM [Roseobacter cerasinus]|uniref:Peptidoglycan-binding protein LysM n=1 Tax=Roseobacter cerasinus TaxID=2602289 RepID=A0A640VWS2_9RHOB|nr:LysM peptidoglycan-binding domain-containing protein [Roseobacter cerasinus]GFE52054.1 peptidoglycan-binding protein LysM [Roseobacter cerasinus]